jgi:hypothetical protein
VFRRSGVCGIAKNPSISIGGYLIGIDSYLEKWRQESLLATTSSNSSSMLQSNNLTTVLQTPVSALQQSFPNKIVTTKTMTGHDQQSINLMTQNVK